MSGIIEHALDMVVEQGLSELSLRPLAQRAGVSVAVITARFGAKADLLVQVTAAAAARDRAFFARWEAFADNLGRADSAIRAALADLAFQDWVGSGSTQAVLMVELVHDRALNGEPFPALEAWLADAGRFWARLIFGSDELSDLALGYILDEVGFTLAARDNPAYQLLRTLCLRRLAEGVLPPVAGGRDQPVVERLIARLSPQAPAQRASDDTKRQQIAASAARIIVSQGIGAVTHRAVALAAGVPPSTVVYHFGAQPALVVAGLHAIIDRFRQSVAAPRVSASAAGEQTTVRDLVKATSLIAMAAVRETSLVPFALDMRRRRGENISAGNAADLGLATDGRFDRTAAQVMSIALFGMQMVAMARRLPEQAACQQGFASLMAWRIVDPD